MFTALRRFFLLSGFAFALNLSSPAQQTAVAPTPPMGWNSWDAYGLTITEAEFRANVDVLKSRLMPFGWQYAVIDEGWYLVNPQDRSKPNNLVYALDHHGRYVPVPARFPSSGKELVPPPPPHSESASLAPDSHVALEETSFAALGSWVHSQGLKFGIHIVRGIPRASTDRNLPIAGSAFNAQDAADTTDACPWDPTNWGVKDNAAGQAWYDSLLQQYAAWGVDLIKVDCISDRPYKLSEIQQIRRAIDKTGRRMVLSLSPGPTALAHAGQLASLANMWRISDDVWDVWAAPAGQPFPQGPKDQFARFAAWQPYAQPGTWPDGDMLPFGQLKPSPGWGAPRASRLTPDEQHTQMTLWAIARSPLIVGANLTLLDDSTLALLTNRDLIRINQTSTHGAQVLDEGDLIAWRADLPGGGKAVALFNLGDSEISATKQLSAFGADLADRDWKVRSVWGGGAPVAGHEFTWRIPAHGCELILLDL